MTKQPTQPATQMTQPRGKEEDGTLAKPIEIPIPSKRDVLGDLTKTARPKNQQRKVRRRRTPQP